MEQSELVPPMFAPPPPMDERVRALLDASGDAVLVVDAEGRILDANSASAEMFGRPVEEIVGLHERDLFDTDSPGTDPPEGTRTRVNPKREDGSSFVAELTRVRGACESEPTWSWLLIRDLGDRVRAEQALARLHDCNELFQALSDAAFEGVIMHSEGVIHMANHAAEVYARLPPGGLVGRRLLDIIAPQSRQMVLEKVAAGDDRPYEAWALRNDGEPYPVELHPRTVPVEIDGQTLRVVALRDMSEHRELEEQLRQIQKMEAIGSLAGGIAHDFNNLLSVILNATELAQLELSEDHPARADLDDVLQAGERAAELTRQLLAFGRKTVLRSRVVDLGVIVEVMRSMLRHLLSEDIELSVHLPTSPARVRADPVQLEQVVLNLAANARDAMAKGGKLAIAVEHVDLDADFARTHIEVTPGHHVKISIADTGVGIPPDVRSRIFEPFFTTKGPRQGTGLGLSTVFGIVKQSGGTIWVDSTVGEGTTFTIYLPATDEPEAPEPPAPPPKPVRSLPNRTVLVVEDEPQVRRVVVEILRRAGYRVVSTSEPEEAIELARTQLSVDLLLTDVVMPKMSGKQLADRVVADTPGIPVIFMSGYNEESIIKRGVLEPGVRFLPKPIVADDLLTAVGRVLSKFEHS
jgi:two-component system cell cycle sensor histidine kinase/response regulator CckA